MEHDEFIGMILSGDAVTWERMIYEIIEQEKMNPWDIDVSKLSLEFSGKIKELQKLDFRLSGKVILAAALLLKMKSDKVELDEILGRKKREVSEKQDEVFEFDFNQFTLEPNVPFPRDRRVTLPELMDALKKAIEVNTRREIRHPIITGKEELEVKKSKYNIKDKMIEVFNRIKDFFKKFKRNELLFEEILPSKKREDVVWTFMPLMFLANNGKVNLKQEELFGPLYVEVNEEDERHD
ncbi:MAG: hypothetical protein PHW96_02280 [Candidatus Nanoarchaeia archaeon]|nr:hypothetical protein [Candidatus Nanoarchaeia archaeon]